MAGKGNPVLLRINNGNYHPVGTKEFSNNFLRAAVQIAVLKGQGKVDNFLADEKKVSFLVEGNDATQITLDLEEEKEYRVLLDGTNLGNMTTNIGGKLVISVDLTTGQPQEVVIERI